MTVPATITLARAIAPHLAGADWAIGGSTLLYRLGIEPRPVDLDIVTTVEHFARVECALSQMLGAGSRPAHGSYRSRHFTRFTPPAGPALEVMAGIGVLSEQHAVEWHFDPSRIELHDGLPWMRADDWLVLYRLFQRPTRVAQLQAYLAAPGTQ